jgi:hypothetical protein
MLESIHLKNVGPAAEMKMDLEQRRVVLRKRPFIRHGEVGNWLVSEAFDLAEPRSLEGEQAIAAAQAVPLDLEPEDDDSSDPLEFRLSTNPPVKEFLRSSFGRGGSENTAPFFMRRCVPSAWGTGLRA